MRLIPFCFFFFLSSLAYSQMNFTEESQNLGLNHYYIGGLGGGVSMVDFNQDGLDDLTFASGSGEAIGFFLNTGNGFNKITLGINFLEETNQVLWVDFDKDGDMDFFATCFEGSNKLYENIGDLIFVDVTVASGLKTNIGNHYGANWVDINRDGWLDLIYAYRAFPLNKPENGIKLFLNNGDKTFLDITAHFNAEDLNKLPFCISALDFDLDKWPDLFYTHDRAHSTQLFRNNRDSSFINISATANAEYVIDGMGICQADINADGLLDMYVTNIEDGNLLLIKHLDTLSNNYYYTEESEARGCQFNTLSWGCNFADFDNDADADLYVSVPTIQNEGQTLSSLLINEDGDFNILNAFAGDTLRSFSNATGDFNNDGLLDIAVLNTFNDPAQIWQNRSNHSRNWLKVDLKGLYSNHEGIGSTVTIYHGTKKQLVYKECAVSFLGQNSNTLHIGLGDDELVDSIKVEWPTGHVDILTDVMANQKILITEGQTNGEIVVDHDVTLLYPPILNPTLFSDFTDSSGIDHFVRHTNFLGGGVAFLDFNNDGYEDLYFTSGRDQDQLYRNNGDGTFDNISATANIDLTGSFYTNGVISGDINNDGWTDLFIATTGNLQESFSRSLLYLNNGNETFTEAWLQQEDEDKSMTMGATFIDYDQDGFLDIYTINYVEDIGFLYDDMGVIIGFDHTCFENKMYRNRDGTFFFDDVSEELGLNDYGCALAVIATDYDNDGDSDLLLANDFGEFVLPNALYRNDSLLFTEVSAQWNADQAIYGMGIAAGDLNNDLDMDYYITNNGSNILLQQNLDQFDEIAATAGVQDQWVLQDSILSVSWGTSFIDYDNDSDLDLYVANGYVPGPAFLETSINNKDVLFRNNGDTQFDLLVDTISGISNRYTSRGSAKGDIDNDGDEDIITAVLNVPQLSEGWESKVYKNENTSDKNWIQFTLEGILANRDAIGAAISLYAQGLTTRKEISGGDSHCSHSSKVLHFGLDTIAHVDSILINWPSRSSTQRIYDLGINQRLHFLEDTTGTFISMVDTMNMDTMMIDTMDVDTSLFALDLPESLDIIAYPIPANLKISISADIAINAFKIVTQHGSIAKEEHFSTGQTDFEIYLKDLSPGYYLLSLSCDDGIIRTKKLVILRD